jgi:hypothetical protein
MLFACSPRASELSSAGLGTIDTFAEPKSELHGANWIGCWDGFV